MPRSDNQANVDNINQIFKSMKGLLQNLYARWQCEKDVEDFADYSLKMMNAFDELAIDLDFEADFVKASKRPFGFTFKFQPEGQFSEPQLIRISLTQREYKWNGVFK